MTVIQTALFLAGENTLNLSAQFLNKEINNAPSALLSYVSTREFLRTREKYGEARAEGERFLHFSSARSARKHCELCALVPMK